MTKNSGSADDKNSLLSRWLSLNKKEPVKKGIETIPSGEDAPLSYGQQRLWFLQQLYPENPFYNYSETYHFKGELNKEDLISSFQQIVKRHDSLRTTINTKDGRAIQQVSSTARIDVQHIDLQSLPEDLRQNEALISAYNESIRPFELTKGPLTRISLIELNPLHHLVVFTLHHIITDEGSMSIFLEELSKHYKAKQSDESLALEALPYQYPDYAFWQRKQPVDKKHLAYWKEKLKGNMPLLNLPHDRARPILPSFEGGFYTQLLPQHLSDKIKIIAKETNVTAFVFLLAAYKVMLYRYSGQEDILVGTPFNNRGQVSLEKVIGFFIDTLVVKTSVLGKTSFLDLLQNVRKSSLEAFSNNNIPFETLVKSLKPDRYMSANPLFQVMFVYHKAPTLPSFGNKLEIESVMPKNGASKFDLTLHIADHGGQLSATFEYAKELFDLDTIQRMQLHFKGLLESIVLNPKSEIDKLNILSTQEFDYLVNDWNNTKREFVERNYVHRLFEKFAEATPDKVAVAYEGQQYDYATLNKKANAIASYLQGLNAGSNKIVGLYADRSLEMIVGIFGILKAGLAYLPLDPEYPTERINFMINDAEVVLILTTNEKISNVSDSGVNVITFEEAESNPSLSLQNPYIAIKDDDLAYVIYTSGSTGKPKGVPIHHRNLLHSTIARKDYYPFQPAAFLLLSSFSFDSSVAGIFWTLSTGGTLVLTKKHAEQDISHLGALIKAHKVSHTLLLPSLYGLLLKHVALSNLESLQCVIVAGEACLPSIANLHHNSLINTLLFNEYGPTEATVWCSVSKISKPNGKAKIVPIGKPIANTAIYVLDENLQPVPKGVVGELYIAGEGLAGGYLNRPEFSKERFLDNPFNNKFGSKIYKTGDLGKLDKEEQLLFLGRADDQVKIRGYRIELTEIEENLQHVEGVDDVVVVIKKEDNTGFGNESEVIAVDQLLALLGGMEEIEVNKILDMVESLSENDLQTMMEEMNNTNK